MYDSPNLLKIEQRFKESIDLYVQHRVPTGGFLRAVLENDLRNAIGSADMDAMDNLKHIVCYLYNEIPSNCWGNKERVEAWLKSGE